jgi:hypothetical protein
MIPSLDKSIFELVRYNNVEEQRLEMYHSLLLSIKEAGGHVNKELLLKMSVADLIDIFAQNGVRFCVKGKNDD